MTVDDLYRMPRHPDWKYELIEGDIVWSYRPRPIPCARSTSLPVRAVGRTIEVGSLGPEESDLALDFVVSVWEQLLPYRDFKTRAVASEEIRGDFTRDLPVPADEAPTTGLIARVEGAIPGLVVLGTVRASHHRVGDDDYFDGHSGTLLQWLTVAPPFRRRGVAGHLLGAAVDTAREFGHEHLLSTFSAGRLPALMWHLRNGFEVLPGYRALRYDEERPWLESSAASA